MLEKLKTLVQQKGDKIRALTDKVEAIYQPGYPQIVAEVIPASYLDQPQFLGQPDYREQSLTQSGSLSRGRVQ